MRITMIYVYVYIYTNCHLYVPRPPMILNTISHDTVGDAEDSSPAIAFSANDPNRHGRRPTRSLRYPQSKPPTSMPINTAELNHSYYSTKQNKTKQY